MRCEEGKRGFLIPARYQNSQKISANKSGNKTKVKDKGL